MSKDSFQIDLSGIKVDVIRKNIKNINLVIYRSSGRVRVSMPKNVSAQKVKEFIAKRVDWIKKHLKIVESLPKKKEPDYREGETHFYFGEPYRLVVKLANRKPSVQLNGDEMIMTVRPGSDGETHEKVMREWYRKELKKRIPALIGKWEKRLGVKVKEWNVKKMKTRWGTCNTRASRIWLSLELAKNPIHHLDYVVLHEIAHLIERSHNARFKSILTENMPDWKAIQREMNNKVC
jgi:predicted metal-dependent hydrolase